MDPLAFMVILVGVFLFAAMGLVASFAIMSWRTSWRVSQALLKFHKAYHDAAEQEIRIRELALREKEAQARITESEHRAAKAQAEALTNKPTPIMSKGQVA